MAAAEKFNLWYGRCTVRQDSTGVRRKMSPAPERLSPRCITGIEDLPTVRLE